MKNKYDSFKYWENLISENKTIRGHMFMNELPTEKSLYIHTLIFSKFNGLKNIWSYFPDEMALLGYIQYSFLQEAFYIWINGRKQGISYIPLKPVEEIIKDGEKRNRITKEESLEMKKQVERIKKLWSLPRNKILLDIFDDYGLSTKTLVVSTIEDLDLVIELFKEIKYHNSITYEAKLRKAIFKKLKEL